MGTNGMCRPYRIHQRWQALAVVAAFVGWCFALLLYGRNAVLWLITGLGLAALLVALLVLVRANRSLKWASNGLCARCLLGAARRLL